MARDSKFGEISIPGIPETEPIIIFRAKDALAPDVIAYYADRARELGLDDHAGAVDKVHTEFREWQARNANIVKLPD